MLPCPKGCTRSLQRFRNGFLAFQGLNAFGAYEQKEAVRVAVPAEMVDEYRVLTRISELLQPPPTLEFYDDLQGVGGLFSGDDWVVMIGIGDMRRIASQVIEHWPMEVAKIYAKSHSGARPDGRTLLRYMGHAAVLHCMAHELGHALIHQGAPNHYAPDDEAGADYYAGRLDAARGKSALLGEIFFWTIGCVGDSCTHPSPDDRAAAYRTGYNAQLAGQ